MSIDPSAPNPTAMPATTTRRRRRRRRRRRPRSPLLAPVAVGAAGLVVGGVLVFALSGDDDGGTIASSTQPPDATVEATATTVPSEVASTAQPPPTVDESPLRSGAARIDGVTYIETAQCTAFPNSHPQAGVGDAHVNVTLHRVESTSGDRMIVERWTEDGLISVGVVEPGGRAGRSESAEQGSDQSSVSLSMSDGSTVLLEHTLSSSGATCPTAVVQGVDEFAFDAFGAIDICQASDSSGLGSIVTFQDGTMLQFRDEGTTGSVTGALRVVGADGSVVEAEVLAEATNGGATGFGLAGTVTPGYVGETPQAVDSLIVELDLASAGSCLPAQEAAFTPA